MRVLFLSDTHYGLKSGGFDRTSEIHRVMNHAVNIAIKERVDLFVHGGDLGHTSNPSSFIHGLWVDIFLKLEGAGIESRFMLGNHDAVHREQHPYGSLSPLAELNLSKVKPVIEPDYDLIGDNSILYLPFMSRTHIPGKVSIDEYLKKFVDEMEDDPTIVFTHLNPSGAEINDDFILRPIEAKVPSALFKMDVAGFFSGHIHKSQKIRSNPGHWVVGAPIATDFGDVGEKRFLLIEVTNDLTVTSIPSGATPLVQLEYDFVDCNEPIKFDFVPSEIRGAGIKVKLRVTEDQRETIDLDDLVIGLLEAGAEFVRKITPTIVRRNENKSVIDVAMSDRDAIDHWIRTRKPSNTDIVMKCALQTLEESI